MVWGWVVVGRGTFLSSQSRLFIHLVLKSFLHDVGGLGYGRYVTSVHPGMHRVCNAGSEICSAHPTSGGPYFWAAAIAKPRDAPFVSWITGWFSLLGQVAGTATIRFVIALLVLRKSSTDSHSQHHMRQFHRHHC
jgi:hypothetical protein